MPSLRLLLRFYWWRLRTHPAQEALAASGIAVGVALIFAIQIANTSVSASVRTLYHELAGGASVEVGARSAEGLSQALVSAVGEAKGVFGDAGVLNAQITVAGPRGQAPLTLYGAEPAIAVIGGPLTREISLEDLSGGGHAGDRTGAPSSRSVAAQLPRIALPEGPARAIGAKVGQPLLVKSGGRAVAALCSHILGAKLAGGVTQSPVAIATLSAAQAVTGLSNRVSRIMVEPKHGQQALAERSLRRLLGTTLSVRPSDSELALLAEATGPSNEATSVFAILALAVGLLIAYNAMLLTLPARRASMLRLRASGAHRSELLALVAIEVALLGAAAVTVGLVLGDLLAGAVFGGVPRYLTSSFPVGTQRVITIGALVSAIAAGVAAAALAAGGPALSSLRAQAPEQGRGSAQSTPSLGLLASRLGMICGAIAIAVAAIISLFVPAQSIVSAVCLALALGLLLPRTVPRLIRWSARIALRARSTAGYLASIELAAVPVRGAAVATTTAVALYAIVAIGGATNDIRRGVSGAIDDIYGGYAVIVSPASYAQTIFQVQPFAGGPVAARIEAIGGVRRVAAVRTAFLDDRGHRLFVIAKPASDPVAISQSQIVEGQPQRLTRLLRAGGWAALSSTLAAEWGLHLGEELVLPTVSGDAHLRLAATIANYGWPGGTVVVGASDFERLWKSAKVGLLEVAFRAGISEARALAAVRKALAGSGFAIAGERAVGADIAAATNQGMSQMSQTATLMLIAAVLAVLAAMAGSIWQRRPRLAALRRLGVRRGELIWMICLESAAAVTLGCLAGVLVGLAGQPLATIYVRNVTGFPEAYSPALALALRTAALAFAITTLGSAALGLAVTGAARRGAGRRYSPIPQRHSAAKGPSASGLGL